MRSINDDDEKLTWSAERARALLDEFGLHDWQFAFMSRRATRRFGDCNHTKKIIRLSPVLVELNDCDAIEDTIRHEIAHALCRPRDGHNARFYAMCHRVGATPTRCYDGAVKSLPRSSKPPSYRRRCIPCDLTWYYRGPISAARACGKCGTRVVIERRCGDEWQTKRRWLNWLRRAKV